MPFRYALMQSFEMHHTNTTYGVPCSDRLALLQEAKRLGFDGVELGLDRDYTEDPLLADPGFRASLRSTADEASVEICSVCLHLLNYDEFSPASENPQHRETSRILLRGVLEACHDVGASVVLLPFFGTALLRTDAQVSALVAEMQTHAPLATSLGVCLALETSLPAPQMLSIVERIGSDAVQVYFDTGNTQGFGFDVIQEIHDLGGVIAQMHIKNHPARPDLVEGSIDFGPVLETLREQSFSGYLVLETPAGDEATMTENLRALEQMAQHA